MVCYIKHASLLVFSHEPLICECVLFMPRCCMLFPLGHFSPCSTHKPVHLAGMEALKALKAPSVEVEPRLSIWPRLLLERLSCTSWTRVSDWKLWSECNDINKWVQEEHGELSWKSELSLRSVTSIKLKLCSQFLSFSFFLFSFLPQPLCFLTVSSLLSCRRILGRFLTLSFLKDEAAQCVCALKQVGNDYHSERQTDTCTHMNIYRQKPPFPQVFCVWSILLKGCTMTTKEETAREHTKIKKGMEPFFWESEENSDGDSS